MNFRYYDADRVKKCWGLDPAPFASKLKAAADASGVDFEWIEAPSEEIPLADASVDTVVSTYTLCTIPEPLIALREMARVLRPQGELLFCEHGRAPDAGVRRWQRRLDPLWTRLSGGCHLDRAIPLLIERGGFRLSRLESVYLPGWRPASFNFWGAASRSGD